MRRALNYSHRKAAPAEPVVINVQAPSVPTAAPKQITERDVWLAVYAAAITARMQRPELKPPVSTELADFAVENFRKRFGGAA